MEAKFLGQNWHFNLEAQRRSFCSGASFSAFTLVELLVVLAISMILIVLSLATLNRVKEKVAHVQVQSRLRSMGSALLSHVAENDGYLIDGANGPTLSAGELSSSRGPAVAFWFNALDYYMGGKDYTIVGMETAERPTWQQDPLKRYETWQKSGKYGVSIGYGWNHQNFGYDAQASNASLGWRTRLALVEFPAKTIIIGTGEDSLNASNVLRNTMIYANSIRCRRYDGGGYYLFLDGHVEKLTPEQVMEDHSYLMKKVK